MRSITYLASYGATGRGILTIMIPIFFNLQIAGETSEVFNSPAFMQTGNAGIQIIIIFMDENDVPLNLLGGISPTMTFVQPDQTSVIKNATFLTNGIDGAITYTTLQTDIAESGDWTVQGAILVGTSYFTTQIAKFKVN